MAINWRKLIVLLGCGILMSSLGACSKQVKQTESDARQTAPATSSTAAEPEAGDAHKGNNQAKSSDKNKLAAAAEKKDAKQSETIPVTQIVFLAVGIVLAISALVAIHITSKHYSSDDDDEDDDE